MLPTGITHTHTHTLCTRGHKRPSIGGMHGGFFGPVKPVAAASGQLSHTEQRRERGRVGALEKPSLRYNKRKSNNSGRHRVTHVYAHTKDIYEHRARVDYIHSSLL